MRIAWSADVEDSRQWLAFQHRPRPGAGFSQALLALAIPALLWCAAPAPAADRPNVLLIITDDQGHGDLGCHGNKAIRTPHLDAFAGQSARLKNFYVSPVCSPTRASLLTGRYNYRTGVVDTYAGRSLMHSEEVTLAEMLRDAGYRTAIFGKWHLGDNYPLRAIDQGFEEALVLKGGGIGQPSDPPGGDHYTDPTLLHNGRAVKTEGYCSDIFTAAALQFISDHRGESFFIQLAFNAPHTPLEVPESYLAPYREAGLDDVTARIYAMVTCIDANIGRLMGGLENIGLAKNTLVFFMTDNGPQQARYNSGWRGLKGTVFEGGIHVPGYMRWPGAIRAGSMVEAIAAHIDIAPTILEACGIQKPAGVSFDGRSLLPLLRGQTSGWPDRTLYFQWHRGDAPELFRACAARSQRYKLIRLDPAEPPLLFDIQEDPRETRDLARELPEVAGRLMAGYESWFHDVSLTRGYTPPRIRVGSAEENPVLLTRQDWRGLLTAHQQDAQGRWSLEVAVSGSYEIRVFPGKRTLPSMVYLEMAGIRSMRGLEPGDRDVILGPFDLQSGPAELEAIVNSGESTSGAEYAEVRRLR